MSEAAQRGLLRTHHHVRPGDIDALGHLNHGRAIELFELGRYDWMTRHALVLDSACLPVVTRVDVNYHREVYLSEVSIGTRLRTIRHYGLEFEQTIGTQDSDRAAVIGSVWISIIDRENRRPVRLRSLAVVEQMQALLEGI